MGVLNSDNNPDFDLDAQYPSSDETPAYNALTDRHKFFVDAYVGYCNMNASAAARAAGYSTAAAMGSQLRNHPKIAAAIQEKIRLKMSANEVLARLSMLAAFDPNDVFSVTGDGKLLIDFEKLKETGALYALRKYSTQRGLAIEFEDRLRALELLGKHYKLFSDVVTMGTRGDGTAESMTDEELARIAAQGLDMSDMG